LNDLIQRNFEISIIIPTLNGADYLKKLFPALKSQTYVPREIIVVDSSSTDDSVKLAEREGCRVLVIPREEFNHGATRNLGARMARGDVLIFMTQDALPANDHFLEKLIEPIKKNLAQATYARQIPYGEASSTECFARSFNYPPKAHIRSKQDIPKLQVKAFFFSDVASGILNSVFKDIRGFSEHLIMMEDMLFCAALLKAGYNVGYQAEALVYHSHNYSLKDYFRRYFDAGVFMSSSKDMFDGVSATGEGSRMLRNQLSYFLGKKEWKAVLSSLFEGLAKYCGFQLGCQEHLLPKLIKRNISFHSFYWR
jgi:rhamnosyltransferase